MIEEQKSPTSQLDLKLPKSGVFYWRVIAEDDEGFLIPPSYDQLFYGVEKPLAAPKLRTPEPRLPAGATDTQETAPTKSVPADDSKSDDNSGEQSTPFPHRKKATIVAAEISLVRCRGYSCTYGMRFFLSHRHRKVH